MKHFILSAVISILSGAVYGQTVPPGYEDAPKCSNLFEYAMVGPKKTIIAGHAVNYKDEKNILGVYDFLGNELITPDYIWIDPVECGGDITFIATDRDGNNHILSRDGKKLACTFKNNVYNIGDDYFLYFKSVNGEERCVVIDSNGNEAFVAEPDILPYRVCEELVLFRDNKNEKDGVMMLNGEIVVPPIYYGIGPFSEGLAMAISSIEESYVNSETGILENRYSAGFIDKTGELKIPFKFSITAPNLDNISDLPSFSDGLCKVEDNGLDGYINKAGEIVIPFRYCFASPFVDGRATVMICNDDTNNKEKIVTIDKEGNEVEDFNQQYAEYERTYTQDSNNYNTFYGVVKVCMDNSEWICPPVYEFTEDYYTKYTSDGYVLAKYKDKRHIIDRMGRVILRDVSIGSIVDVIPG